MQNTLDTYKTITQTQINERPSYELSSDESSKVSTILSNFFTYFVNKHS